jgi:hypothetical protein
MQKIDLQLGVAARALMGFAFDDARGASLMPQAIGLVGRTFGSDARASKQLVERLLDPPMVGGSLARLASARVEAEIADQPRWISEEPDVTDGSRNARCDGHVDAGERH